jgi:hypothetical protein
MTSAARPRAGRTARKGAISDMCRRPGGGTKRLTTPRFRRRVKNRGSRAARVYRRHLGRTCLTGRWPRRLCSPHDGSAGRRAPYRCRTATDPVGLARSLSPSSVLCSLSRASVFRESCMSRSQAGQSGPAQCPALLVAAPASGQGKTTVSAGLARLHRRLVHDGIGRLRAAFLHLYFPSIHQTAARLFLR